MAQDIQRLAQRVAGVLRIGLRPENGHDRIARGFLLDSQVDEQGETLRLAHQHRELDVAQRNSAAIPA
ncbi:MAG: hypothetical protein HY703_04790 [Gemmatimonadetes bacterium]|nr:hypothetical protein [Gemmatimonadota bacterium]